MKFPLFRGTTLSALFVASVAAAPMAQSYKVEEIVLPDGVPPEVGALDFDKQGTLYVSLRRGDVLTAKPTTDPKAFPWKLFATGFDNGTGMVVAEPGRILVSSMADLTEATDTNGDGQADRYRMITNDWGLSGNYHETTSVVSDRQGGYYLALGTASHNGPTFEHTQNEYNKFGRRGRNFSGVKFRGWTMHYTNGELKPFASGFRMQNGLTLDEEGNVWSSDNQGDWKAVTPLYLVREGKFYGHPASLVWDSRWPADKDPIATFRSDIDAYNAYRTKAAVELPHMELVRSGAEPLQIATSNTAFGPFAGQMLVPDNNGPRIARVMLEKVGGDYQGSATMFLQQQGLRTGNNRLRFSPDGKSLYVGQTVRGWGRPAEGLQRITWQGGTPFTIKMINIRPTGFRLTFTAPVNDAAKKADGYVVRSMIYQPKWTYGSEPHVRAETLNGVKVIDDHTIELTINSLQPGCVYHIKLADPVAAASGEATDFRDFYYTANRLPIGQ